MKLLKNNENINKNLKSQIWNNVIKQYYHIAKRVKQILKAKIQNFQEPTMERY